MRTFTLRIRKRSYIDVVSAKVTATGRADDTFNPVTIHLGDENDKPVPLTSRPRVVAALQNYADEIGVVNGDYFWFKTGIAAKAVRGNIVKTRKNSDGSWPTTPDEVDQMIDPAAVAYSVVIHEIAERVKIEASGNVDLEAEIASLDNLTEVEDLDSTAYAEEVKENLDLDSFDNRTEDCTTFYGDLEDVDESSLLYAEAVDERNHVFAEE